MCAGNVTPAGMVITATGTSPNCSGSCQARRLAPACGVVMKICADQAIPKGYQLDGITSTPACDCLGREDNAYVIKYAFEGADGEEADPLRQEPADPSEISAQERAAINDPYGYPPFGNTLCLAQEREREHLPPFDQMGQEQRQLPSEGMQPNQNPRQNQYPQQFQSSQQPNQGYTPPDVYDTEPFRIGQ
ncbi:MAG: hypothetical protein ACREQX_15355 [Candidatus Binataceae bacterium]